jgi:hypothetical protein
MGVRPSASALVTSAPRLIRRRTTYFFLLEKQFAFEQEGINLMVAVLRGSLQRGNAVVLYPNLICVLTCIKQF